MGKHWFAKIWIVYDEITPRFNNFLAQIPIKYFEIAMTKERSCFIIEVSERMKSKINNWLQDNKIKFDLIE